MEALGKVRTNPRGTLAFAATGSDFDRPRHAFSQMP